MGALSLLNSAISKIAFAKNRKALLSEWDRLRDIPDNPQSTSPIRRLLLIPSDAATLTGARGDEAMIYALVDKIRSYSPSLHVGALVATDKAATAAKSMGFEPIAAWSQGLTLNQQFDLLKSFQPDGVIALGADIMDGYYGVDHPSAVLILVDLLARWGARSAFVGFSFNKTPSVSLQPIFTRVSDKVIFNLRDPISLQRFRSFTSRPGNLVADAAFMLEPSSNSHGDLSEVLSWTQKRRAKGDSVLAFNIHPMLIKGSNQKQISKMVSASIDALARSLETRNVSWLLLPHDYRDQFRDDRCLEPIFHNLSRSYGERLFHPSSPLDAKQLKAIAGMLDGIVTGRMHLAIAALGQGVPIAGLSYQDKFQGLLEHFEVPSDVLLNSCDVIAPKRLESFIINFIDELDSLRSQVLDRLPSIIHLSEMNLDLFINNDNGRKF